MSRYNEERVVKEEWAVQKKRIQESSPFGGMKGWDLRCVIIKSGT
jgi:hypothetical protein